MKLSQWKWVGSAVVALALAPVSAFAEKRVVVSDEPDAVLQVGAGVNNFTVGLDDVTDPGAAWDVRAIFAPKNFLGMEAAYFGALNELSGSDDVSLLTNGGEALIRANLGGDAGDVQPYVAAGLGIASQDIVSRDDASDSISSEDYKDSTDLLVPAAAGLDIYLADTVTIGARLGYKFYFDDEVKADSDAANAQAWTATARLGAAF